MVDKVVKQRAKRIRHIRLIRESAVFMKLGAKIRAYLFTGILVTAPVAITFYMAYKFVFFVDRAVNNLLPEHYKFANFLPVTIPGLGLVVLLLALILVGMFTAGFLGKFIVRLGEWIVYKIPLVSSVYSLLKQVFGTFFSNKTDAFSKVVMIEYPRAGIWTLAFVSADATPKIQHHFGKEKMIEVFVPTTPNPTSGFLLFIPKNSVKDVDMTVEEALKFIVSCGLVTE